MIQNIKNTLKRYDFINFSLLFGSYANNTNRELSDIDIAIYTKEEIDLLKIGMIISDLEESLNKKVDLVILNNLYKIDTKLAFNILDNHKIIFMNDKEEFIDFKVNTLKYYLDRKYMYDMFDKALLNRLDNGTFGKTKAS